MKRQWEVWATAWKGIALLALVLASQSAFAQTLEITGPVKAAGRGCPGGNVNVTFTPDMGAFSILFDQMSAQVSGAGSDSKNCDMEIPLRLENNWRIRILRVEHRGFVSLAVGDRAQLTTRFQFFGGNMCRGPGCVRPMPVDLRKDYVGPLEGDVLEVSGAQRTWDASGCGGDMSLRVETGVRAGSRAGGAVLSLDTMDGNFGDATYHMMFERCEVDTRPIPPNRPNPPGRPPRPPRYGR